MARTHHRYAAVAALATLLSAAPLAAQGPVGTGVNLSNNRDLSWDVATGGGGFVDAFLVVSPPSPPWATNVPGDYQWISFDFDATGPSGSPYLFRTTFDLTGYDPTSASLSFRCAIDNVSGAVRLNGTTTGSACPVHAISGVQTITSGFVAGINTWEFEVSGDATTDGLVVDVTGFSARQVGQVVPEPGTWALLATGLAAIGAAGARRRRDTA